MEWRSFSSAYPFFWLKTKSFNFYKLPTLELNVRSATCAPATKATPNDAPDDSNNHQDKARQSEIFEPGPGAGLQLVFNWHDLGGRRKGSGRCSLVGILHWKSRGIFSELPYKSIKSFNHNFKNYNTIQTARVYKHSISTSYQNIIV